MSAGDTSEFNFFGASKVDQIFDCNRIGWYPLLGSSSAWTLLFKNQRSIPTELKLRFHALSSGTMSRAVLSQLYVPNTHYNPQC